MKILFQGDSITDCDRSRTTSEPNLHLGEGYATLIASRLCFENQNLEFYNRGVSGNRICDIYSRWIEDTLNIDFDVLSILCGINDVGFSLRLNKGADSNKFKFVYDRMLYEVKEKNPNAKIILMEPFLLKSYFVHPEFGNDIYDNWDLWSEEIKKRAKATKELAEKYDATFVPLYDDFQALAEKFGAEYFSKDCVHPTPQGHEFIARKWIECCADLILSK